VEAPDLRRVVFQGSENEKNMCAKKHYGEDFKKAAIQKLLSPNSIGATRLSEELGLGNSTLYAWKQKFAKGGNMKTGKTKSLKNWTPEDKLEALIKTATMSEHELGEFLRSQGLYSANLEQWKKDFTNGLKADLGRPKIDPEIFALRKKEQALESELRRKDKALAEVTARVVLLKKSQLLFGVDEDDS
jgi:transposase-like protein